MLIINVLFLTELKSVKECLSSFNFNFQFKNNFMQVKIYKNFCRDLLPKDSYILNCENKEFDEKDSEKKRGEGSSDSSPPFLVLYRCPACEYTVNADVNTMFNIPF